jgi:hypothetical protein
MVEAARHCIEAALVTVAVVTGLFFYGKLIWDGYWFWVGLFAA